MMQVRLQRPPLTAQQRKSQRADDDADRVGQPSRQPGDHALDQPETDVGDHDGSSTGCIGGLGGCGACSCRNKGMKTSHWTGSRRMIRSKNCTIRSVVTWMSSWVSPVRLTSLGASLSAMQKLTV